MRDPRDPAARDRRARTDGRLARARGARAGGRRRASSDSIPMPGAREAALERGCVDEAAATSRPPSPGAELVVLCAPVAALPGVLAELAELAPGATVTDIGSTKAGVVAAVPAALRPRFIGGHPICGMETRGAQNARAELFEGATWYLTPLAETEPARLRDLHRLRGRARRHARRDRRGRARPPAGGHEPPAARARQPARRAGRRGAHRRPRPAHGDRRLVPRHDARGRREPAHLGRHLPRQPRGARGRAARAPALAGRGADGARGRRRGLPRALDRPGLRPSPARARGAVRPAARGALPRAGARSRPPRRVRGHHAGARRRAHQHRGLRAAPLHARARRHGRAARGRPGRRRARRRAARRRRATARSPRRCWRMPRERRDRIRPPRGRARGRARRRARGAGDKSISHRALLLGAVSDGTTEVSGFGANADTLATLAAVESLGARVERLDEACTRLRVHGCGLRGLRAPEGRSTSTTRAR